MGTHPHQLNDQAKSLFTADPFRYAPSTYQERQENLALLKKYKELEAKIAQLHKHQAQQPIDLDKSELKEILVARIAKLKEKIQTDAEEEKKQKEAEEKFKADQVQKEYDEMIKQFNGASLVILL